MAPLTLSLLLLLVYALAALLNLGVPDSGARYPRRRIPPGRAVARFRRGQSHAVARRRGRLVAGGTTIFWGAGATLQFAVLRWAVDGLGLTLDKAAYLQAAVAVGVVVGAAAAGRWVPLGTQARMLWAGVVLGAADAAGCVGARPGAAALLLALVGAVGGAMVVPLNALLQHRGHVLLRAGRSIAVQGFNENASVLAMLAVYAALIAHATCRSCCCMLGFGLGDRGRHRAADVRSGSMSAAHRLTAAIDGAALTRALRHARSATGDGLGDAARCARGARRRASHASTDSKRATTPSQSSSRTVCARARPMRSARSCVDARARTACATKAPASPSGTSGRCRPLRDQLRRGGVVEGHHRQAAGHGLGVTLPKVSVRLGNRNRSAEA